MQFRHLLEDVRGILPYQKLAGACGHPTQSILSYFFNYGVPLAFLRWFLSTGALWTSPVFREWKRSKRAVMVFDVVNRFKTDFHPELVRQYKQAGMYYAMCGGRVAAKHFAYFVLAMSSARAAKTHLEQFDSIVPSLVQASRRAYPRSLLTKRERGILARRAMGQITKQIAAAEGISERTVREHLQQIKKKLYTDDIVNAVVIAIKSGMLRCPWEKGMSEH
jgi:DNA-binding CsgD family transcriptional regulator